jgi:hypothetical protein
MQCQTLNPVYSQLGSANSMTILNAGETIAKEFGVPLQVSKSPELKVDNYVPRDVPRLIEKDFEEGINQWSRWLNMTSRGSGGG